MMILVIYVHKINKTNMKIKTKKQQLKIKL